MNKRCVGKCGNCGGRVIVPTVWMGVNPPIPRCEKCGSSVDQTAGLPTLPMQPKPTKRRVLVTKWSVHKL